jgi:hypothetical protein
VIARKLFHWLSHYTSTITGALQVTEIRLRILRYHEFFQKMTNPLPDFPGCFFTKIGSDTGIFPAPYIFLLAMAGACSSLYGPTSFVA